MDAPKTILVVGTYDTKATELAYLADRIRAMGGSVLTMDVSVLGDPPDPTNIAKDEVARAGGMPIAEVIALGDEHSAFRVMSAGAARVVRERHTAGAFDGMIALGGTMGTDLALDCAQALPLGVPKYIVSTVAFSPLIPPARLAADVQMILWAGGLYGLNDLCRAALSQAAGAVLGAARAVEPPRETRPLVGMTSLGSSCLSYMKRLKPALEARGFDVAVFHSTGMGGMAFERLAAEGAFALALDLCQQELSNLVAGSLVSSGDERTTSAGRHGVPQIVAPGAIDLVDFAGWQTIPERFRDRPFHEHNRLIRSTVLKVEERRETARELGRRLALAIGPCAFVLPTGGVEEWDREGHEAHDPAALTAFVEAARAAVRPPVDLVEIAAHINDAAFSDAVLGIVDRWLAEGLVRT
jgi:uncharacterized protein (UPF0261 family)